MFTKEEALFLKNHLQFLASLNVKSDTTITIIGDCDFSVRNEKSVKLSEFKNSLRGTNHNLHFDKSAIIQMLNGLYEF